jgi:TLC domain
MFGWLIVGELSTPLLNIRWFLIRQGLGDTAFMKVVSMSFAAVFFLTRFVIYGSGLLHLFATISHLTPDVSRASAACVVLFVLGGFGLNLLWLTKIAKMAGSKPKIEKVLDASLVPPPGAPKTPPLPQAEFEKAKDI